MVKASRSAGTSNSGNSKGSPQQHTAGQLCSKGITKIPNVSESIPDCPTGDKTCHHTYDLVVHDKAEAELIVVAVPVRNL
ncbi:hypothetical protein PIB30_043679 [Stylosanthes scabra]|uniref:Uncharacterized protein n=1 Tax=Stylosanthes scabra TaxID=79078 RepID=A0ABU6QFW0_9FABA|nr:hypothetical protein [Stylosanthes scabra]